MAGLVPAISLRDARCSPKRDHRDSRFARPGDDNNLRRAPELAAARRRDRRALSRIFVELVAQRADRDAEDIGRMGAVAEAVLERLQDQVTLDLATVRPTRLRVT